MKLNTDETVFLDALQKRFPEKRLLTKILEEILCIEREAVYRRLKGSVPFTFSEISKICKKYSISLDNIIGIGIANNRIKPCRLTFLDYLHPEEEDYIILESFINLLDKFKDYEQSEVYSATNTLPQLMYVNYEYLYRFYLFKWSHQQGDFIIRKKFREINPPERLKKINKAFHEAHKHARYTSHILDNTIFQSIVQDIKYFRDVNLIEEDEVGKLKEELFQLIDEMESLMIKGHFENQRRIDIYISHIHLKSSHVCLSIDENSKLSMTKWFAITDTASFDIHTFTIMKNWMQSLKRSSVLVSGSAEMSRLKFIKAQREIVDKL